MIRFHALFHGTTVYINGKNKYKSNEILTAYLNLQAEDLKDWHEELAGAMENLLLRTNFSDEERYVSYDLTVHAAQSLIEEIDAVWKTLPPYRDFAIPDSQNKLRILLSRFADMLDGEREINPLVGITEDDSDDAYISGLRKFVPASMDWYWMESGSQHALEMMRRMEELNGTIRNFFQPYIDWTEDVLRVKCCYEKLVSDYLHIRHGFLMEAELAKQFELYFQTESRTVYAYQKLNGPAPVKSGHEVFAAEDGTLILCAGFDFDRLGAFLYEDFFRGLQEHFIPKCCSNCGRWFLLDAGIYSDYCELPLASDETKTCRMVSARKKYDTKCKEDPIWNIYNKAYKAHYARIAKKKMTKPEFEAWSRYAIELREQAERNEISFEEYVRAIKK